MNILDFVLGEEREINKVAASEITQQNLSVFCTHQLP